MLRLEQRVLTVAKHQIKLHYEISAAPKPHGDRQNVLVFMHGLGGTLCSMHDLMQSLRQQRCEFLDSYTFANLSLPAHNNSDDLDEPWKPSHLAAATASLLADLGCNNSNSRITVVGIAFTGYAFLEAIRKGWPGGESIGADLPPLRKFASVDWTPFVSPGVKTEPPKNEQDAKRLRETMVQMFSSMAETPKVKHYVTSTMAGLEPLVFQKSAAYANSSWRSQGEPIDAMALTLKEVPEDAQLLMLHNSLSSEAQRALAGLRDSQYFVAKEIPSTSFAVSQDFPRESAALLAQWMEDTDM